MKRFLALLITLILATTLIGCASLAPHFEKPQVSVNSFKALPSNGMSPSFEIGLRVLNPNNTELPLKGIAYSASIEGNQIFSGVTSQLPIIPAYGEKDVKLKAQADLFGGLKLFADLLKARDTPLSYTLKVKLDLGTFSIPIYITHEGILTLPQAN